VYKRQAIEGSFFVPNVSEKSTPTEAGISVTWKLLFVFEQNRSATMTGLTSTTFNSCNNKMHQQ